MNSGKPLQNGPTTIIKKFHWSSKQYFESLSNQQ